jgi:hypothetical protein
LNNVAKKLKEEKSLTKIAFINANEESGKNLRDRFDIKGFPTTKLFKDGEFAWDYNERDENKVLEYLRNPKEKPAEPAPEPEWKDTPTDVIHAEDANFQSLIKTKKHSLVVSDLTI